MSIHPQENVRCGDDWQFTGPLVDNSGNVLPLAGASFVYKLDSLDGSKNFYQTTTVTIVNANTGTVLYSVPAATTVNIPPGTYYDTLRITLSSNNGGGTYTMIEGLINAAPQST